MTTAPPPAEADTSEELTAATLDRLLPADLAGIDLDRMRQAAPVLRTRLLDLLRDSATIIRKERGTVVAPEDTYDLVRRLTASAEVLRQWAQAFTEAAREADALVAEEAVTAMGESDGIPNGSLFVPDGAGQRIAVRSDWAPGDSVWDVGTLTGWLAEDTIAEQGVGADTDRPVFTAQEATGLARDALARLLALGRFTPSATAIKGLRTRLAERQRDADAAVIGQVRTVGARTYKGVKITREEA